jgi:hypothetical protein
VLPAVKNGSLHMLQATMLGWLRCTRIMSVSVASTLASNGAWSAALAGYAPAVSKSPSPVAALPQNGFSDQNSTPSWSQASENAGAFG